MSEDLCAARVPKQAAGQLDQEYFPDVLLTIQPGFHFSWEGSRLQVRLNGMWAGLMCQLVSWKGQMLPFWPSLERVNSFTIVPPLMFVGP